MRVPSRKSRLLRSVLVAADVQGRCAAEISVTVGREGGRFFTEIEVATGWLAAGLEQPPSEGWKRHSWQLPRELLDRIANSLRGGFSHGARAPGTPLRESDFHPSYWAEDLRREAFPSAFLFWLSNLKRPKEVPFDVSDAEREFYQNSALKETLLSVDRQDVVRISLEVTDLGLKRIPWEYLFPPSHPPISIVRKHTRHYLGRERFHLYDTPYSADAAVVVACANPGGAKPDGSEMRRYDAEKVIETIASSTYFWAFSSINHNSPDTIVDPIAVGQFCRKQRASVLHLACHGEVASGTPLLYFESKGRPMPVTAAQMAFELDRTGCLDQLKLVVLDVCWGATPLDGQLSIAETLLDAGVPAVVAWNSSIRQTTCDSFTGAFYSELSHCWGNSSIEVALLMARAAMHSDRVDEWGLVSLGYRRPSGYQAEDRPDVGKDLSVSGPHFPSEALMLWPALGEVLRLLFLVLRSTLPRRWYRLRAHLDLPRFQTAARRSPRWFRTNLAVSFLLLFLGAGLLGQGHHLFPLMRPGVGDVADKIFLGKGSGPQLRKFRLEAKTGNVGQALLHLTDASSWSREASFTGLRILVGVIEDAAQSRLPALARETPITSERIERIVDLVGQSAGAGSSPWSRVVARAGIGADLAEAFDACVERVLWRYLGSHPSAGTSVRPSEIADLQTASLVEIRLGVAVVLFITHGNLNELIGGPDLESLALDERRTHRVLAYMAAQGIDDSHANILVRANAARVALEMSVRALAWEEVSAQQQEAAAEVDGLTERYTRPALHLAWRFTRQYPGGPAGRETAYVRHVMETFKKDLGAEEFAKLVEAPENSSPKTIVPMQQHR